MSLPVFFFLRSTVMMVTKIRARTPVKSKGATHWNRIAELPPLNLTTGSPLKALEPPAMTL